MQDEKQEWKKKDWSDIDDDCIYGMKYLISEVFKKWLILSRNSKQKKQSAYKKKHIHTQNSIVWYALFS